MKGIWKYLGLALAAAALIALAVCWCRHAASELGNRGTALPDVVAMLPAQNQKLGQVVLESWREYRTNAVNWSVAYFSCVFGSALLSALAALLLKLEVLGDRPELRNDLAAASATLAALLVTLSTTGDFQHKWRANRMAASEMENLLYELLRPDSVNQLDDILSRIQASNTVRNLGVVGDAAEATPAANPSKGQEETP